MQGLIVEDLPASARVLATALTQAFPGIGITVAGTLAEARSQVHASRLDIALIDLNLPDGSGVDLIACLLQQLPDCHRIVTTIYADDRHLFPALQAGAQGYLLKDQPVERLVAALQALDRGEPPLSPAIAQRLLRTFNDGSSDDKTPLTSRETETLTLIAKGLRLSEVAELLGVTRNTAAGYVKNIYRKLNISSRAEATLEATRMGLIKTSF